MSGSSPSSEPDGRRLILIVDDEPSVRAMVHASIRVKDTRYRAIEAGNATDALVEARAQQPDARARCCKSWINGYPESGRPFYE